MATAAEIDEVQELLGPTASDDGWTEARIGDDLDSGLTAQQIALAYWEARMAKTSAVVNVTESGSSRSLSDIHKHATEMAKYYKGKTEAAEETAPRRGLRSITLRRA